MSNTTTLAISSISQDLVSATVAVVASSPAAHEPAPSPADQTARLHIRPYTAETDLPGIEALFNKVYHSTYAFKNLTRIAFLVFCRAYLDTFPETCFVLASPCEGASPTILGYIVATPNSAAFCAEFVAGTRDFRSEIEAMSAAPRREEVRDPALRGRMMEHLHQRNAWVAAVGSAAKFENVVFSSPKTKFALGEKYPAHFHLAVALEVRRHGYGLGLVRALEEKLTGLGVAGVFAATPTGNKGARALYEGCGFSALQTGVEQDDGGEPDCRMRGGSAEMEKNVYLVKSL